MEVWIEEFLFRGRPPSGPGSDQPPAWHVVVGKQADSPLDPGNMVRKTFGPYSIEQAEAEGWPLPQVLAEINAEAVKRVNELEQAVAVKDADNQSISEQASQLAAEVESQAAEIMRLSALNDVRAAEIDALKASI